MRALCVRKSCRVNIEICKSCNFDATHCLLVERSDLSGANKTRLDVENTES